MSLFGLYSLSHIPHLEENHRRFAELNRMPYAKFNVRSFYEKWALVYRLLETHPGETMVFIDAFSYFASGEFGGDLNEQLLIQDLNGKVMDNFFVVRSCQETRKIFHEVQRSAAGRFTAEGSFLFDIPLPSDLVKPYGFRLHSGKIFNCDLAVTNCGKFFDVGDLPLGFSEHTRSESSGILVARYGGHDWPSQLWTAADILCHHSPSADLSYIHEPAFEIVNPGRRQALLTLSCAEPRGLPPSYAAVSERNFRKYAEGRDVTLYIYKGIPDAYRGLHSTWTKPYLVLRHLPFHEYVSWVDADILISSDFQLPEGEDVIVYNDPGTWLFNAGFMTFRSSAKTVEYLHAVITRCESIGDRSSLYVNGSDQTQFIEEYKIHFPDALPRSNLTGNTPVVLDAVHEPSAGLWHFMGLNPPAVRALIMDYYDRMIVDTPDRDRNTRPSHRSEGHNESAGHLHARVKSRLDGTRCARDETESPLNPAYHQDEGVPSHITRQVSKRWSQKNDTNQTNIKIRVHRDLETLSSQIEEPNKIPVVFCVDRSYLPFCSVAVNSLLVRGGLFEPLVYIFLTSLDDHDLEYFEKLVSQHNVTLVIVQMGTHRFDGLPPSQHIANTAYAKLLLPRLLSQHKKILYLDSDVLVVGDIYGLLQLDTGNAPIAALSDTVGGKVCKMETFKTGEHRYLNSGVMLIDTGLWNRLEITEKALALLRDAEKLSQIATFADQCILNYILAGNFLPFETRYNRLVFEPVNLANLWSDAFPTPSADQLSDLSILHFAGGCKVWNPESSLDELWALYSALAEPSPWFADIVGHRNKGRRGGAPAAKL